MRSSTKGASFLMGATAVGLAIAASISMPNSEPDPGPNSPFGSSESVDAVAFDRIGFSSSWADMVDWLRTVADLNPMTFQGTGESLESHADQAAVAALLVGFDPDTNSIDLAGKPVMADRVAIGLNQLDLSFGRSIEPDEFGEYGTHIALDSTFELADLDELQPESDASAAARFATIVELSGTPEGRLATSDVATAAEQLGAQLGVQTRRVGSEVWIANASSVERLAQLLYVDPSTVPIIGENEPAPTPPASSQSSVFQQLIPADSPQGVWRTGTTGSFLWYLDPGGVPEMEDGSVNVGWNNGEAQRYLPRTVSFDGGVLRIVTRPTPTPDVETLPFTSGLVVTEDLYQWGTTTVEVQLPEGSGLWPAVWLLDSEACEAPGRCSGYDTDAYHEIDLIETRTSEPDVAHASVHWGTEGRTASNSATAQIANGADAPTHVTVVLERRPGLLVWWLDGEVVHVVGGEVFDFESGPHRAAPMYLIINTAVGGSFAGDQLVGRDGEWWGDARVPEGFGNLDWNRAEMTITSATFLGLGG